MGEVLKFDRARLQKLAKEQLSKCDDDDDGELSARIDRIKQSIARINNLLAELRSTK